MTTPPPKDPLEDILRDLEVTIMDIVGDEFAPKQEGGSLERQRLLGLLSKVYVPIEQAKQQILTHYISYDELDRLIGEDETGKTYFGLPMEEQVSSHLYARNQLRAELKAALKKRRESNG